MKFSTNRLLTSKNIFKLIDSYNIFKAYSTNFTRVGVSFISDLPGRSKKDTSPSCQIEYIGGDLLYTDFGEGSYRAIPYVMRKFNLSFRKALSKINIDFGLGLIDNIESRNLIHTPLQKYHHERHTFLEKSTTILDVKYQPFTRLDLDYWESFGWTETMLKMASIRSISDYWLTMKHKGIENVHYMVRNELAFSFDYYRHDDIFRRKLYFPERKDHRRFISNVDNSIIQNWDLLPKNGGEILFITSSKKDCGPITRVYNDCKLNFQWNSIAPNSERAFIPVDKLYKLKQRFNNIVLYYDNDDVGIRSAQKLSKLHDLQYIYNPIGSPKDPADFVKEYGLREFNWMLQNKLNYGN